MRKPGEGFRSGKRRKGISGFLAPFLYDRNEIFCYIKKESRIARFFACGGSLCDLFPLRRSAIYCIFYRIGKFLSYSIKSVCLGTHSRRARCRQAIITFRASAILLFMRTQRISHGNCQRICVSHHIPERQ